MNEQRDFNPSRLELARRRRGMTKRDLVQAVGVSRRSLAGYSKGEHEPAPETIVRFAAVLRFPTDFFYGPSLEEATVEGSSFRALSTISSRLRNRAIAAGNNWNQSRRLDRRSVHITGARYSAVSQR